MEHEYNNREKKPMHGGTDEETQGTKSHDGSTHKEAHTETAPASPSK